MKKKQSKEDAFFHIFMNNPVEWNGKKYDSWYDAYKSEKKIENPIRTASAVYENGIELIEPLKLAKAGIRVADI